MMAGITAWWRGLTRREHWLLATMLALLVLVIGWFAIVQPLRQARINAADRLAQANADLGDINARSASIRAAEARGRADDATPLLETVRQRAAAAGIPAEGVVAAGDGQVSVRIAAVKPAALLGWIGDIESRDGIAVDRLALTRNADATIAVELGLRRGRP